MPKNDSLNVKQLARAFGVSSVSIRNWIDRGVPCEKTEKGYLFNLAEVIQWREKYQQEIQKGDSDYNAAKAEREVWKAKITKLHYERLSGELVPLKEIEDFIYTSSRVVRDSLMNISSRVSVIIAAETDPVKISEILNKEIRQTLENLIESFKNKKAE